jgi:hypothetical protein
MRFLRGCGRSGGFYVANGLEGRFAVSEGISGSTKEAGRSVRYSVYMNG